MSMPAGRTGKEGALGPCCTLLAGSSMDRWFGSFLETSDSPVLPPCPRCAIPHPSPACSPLSPSWGVGPAHVPSSCPSPLPAAIPQIPVRVWVLIREWHLGSRSSLCKLGYPQASKGTIQCLVRVCKNSGSHKSQHHSASLGFHPDAFSGSLGLRVRPRRALPCSGQGAVLRPPWYQCSHLVPGMSKEQCRALSPVAQGLVP